MERDDATGTNALGDLPQGSSRVAHEHEYEPAHGSVEESPGIDRPSIRLTELDIGDPLGGAPPPRP
jgi:hypothetical protein